MYVYVDYDPQDLSGQAGSKEFGPPQIEEVDVTLWPQGRPPDLTVHPDQSGCVRFSLGSEEPYHVSAEWDTRSSNHCAWFDQEWVEPQGSGTKYVDLTLSWNGCPV